MRLCGWLSALLLLASVGAHGREVQDASLGFPSFDRWSRDTRLAELSGLASVSWSSRRLWALTDSGSPSEIFLIDTWARPILGIDIAGVQANDWEDMDAFEVDGAHFLLIADTGDNGRLRESVALHIIAEPTRNQTVAAVDYTINLKYPDGPQDVEAVAVRGSWVYLIRKRVSPAILYRVPLARSATVVTAEVVAELPQMEQLALPMGIDPMSNAGRYAWQPTAMQFDCSGTLWLLSYAAIFKIDSPDRRHSAVQDDLHFTRHLLPPTPQAEALSFDRRCRFLFVGSEKLPSPFYRFRVKVTESAAVQDATPN